MRYAILGASSGIGLALTASLADDGHQLWTGARRIAALRGYTRAWPNVQPCYCDVSRPSSVAAWWEHIGWAGGAIDGLVVTAGVQGEINKVADSDPEAWWATVATNLYGPYLAVRYGLAHLAPNARILLFAGGGSHSPWPHYSAYACAKAGVARLVETLAQELPDGQTVNALAPGFCATPIHEATQAAGYAHAGGQFLTTSNLLYELQHTHRGEAAIDTAVACARWLLQDAPAALTGRTISAQHDPWQTDPAALLADGAGTTTRVKPQPGMMRSVPHPTSVVTAGPLPVRVWGSDWLVAP